VIALYALLTAAVAISAAAAISITVTVTVVALELLTQVSHVCHGQVSVIASIATPHARSEAGTIEATAVPTCALALALLHRCSLK
jgi:hypothetical protein